MKLIFFTLFLVVANSSFVYSQITATTPNGRTVILFEDGIWRYESNAGNKTLSEQYDEVAKYAKDKLGKNINSYDYLEKEEAKEYVEKLMDVLKLNKRHQNKSFLKRN